MSRNRMRPALLLMLAVVLIAVPAAADLNIYASFFDEPAGTPILGGATQTNRAGQAIVWEFHHLMEVPGGVTTVDHETMILTIPLNDPAIPALLQKMDTSGLLRVHLDFTESDGQGGENEYLWMDLTDAKLVSFEPLSPNNQIPELANLPATARLRLTYATLQYYYPSLPPVTTYTLTNSGN